MDKGKDWNTCNSETFWREVATCSHVVQVYETNEALLNLLEDFIVGGVSVGDFVIVIATKEHLAALERRLEDHGLNADALRAANQYLPLDAEAVLAKFMVNDLPDENLFTETITAIFDQVRTHKKQVRAFGEMVAILWKRGNGAATVRLEHLWNAFFEKENFSLFCAYSQDAFTDDATNTLSHICKAHSRIISNEGISRFDLSYLDVKKL